MKEWAVIEDGMVVNTILWDGESGWTPNEHQTVVEIPDVPEGDQHAGIGWTYSDGEFLPPPDSGEITPDLE
ncbi:TPA: hypothetical protein ACGEYS_002911 [Kluyvera cryocrescens]|nr:hypothetical protein [Kluyvera cryocrescens]